MTIDIVALGEPLYELNQQSDGRFLAGFGGDTSNVVIAAARLGASTAYATRLGGDMFGDAIMALWRTENIDARAVTVDPDAPTGIYFVSHGAAGHSFTYRRKHSAASLMTPADVPESIIASAKYLHVSGISQAISKSAAVTVDHAIATAGKAKVKISFDTNYRPSLWSPEIARLAISRAAAKATVLKTSIEDSEALFGLGDPAAIARHFLAIGSLTVIVTLGAAGVHVATAGTAMTLPGCRVAAVDATGAGDAFTGALLAELSGGVDLQEAARFANAAAALSTMGYGAIAPLPRRIDVEKFLRNHA